MDVQPPYRIGQIVQAEIAQRRLYAEVRLIATNFKGEVLCWVRPLVITHVDPLLPQDVRRSVDVIWPIEWFSPTFDTDLIDLWPYLDWEQVVFLGQSSEHLAYLEVFSQLFYQSIYAARGTA